MPDASAALGMPSHVTAPAPLADVRRRLPVRARLVAAGLYVFDGERWRERARLPFRAVQAGR